MSHMSHTPSLASPEDAIAHALAEATTYGEYELCYPSVDNPHRVVLRVVMYGCLQAWYVPGAPYEWIPISGEDVITRLECARSRVLGGGDAGAAPGTGR
jgi:hypothetical protein